MNAWNRDELFRLFGAAADRTITAEEAARLAEILQGSSEARRLWFLHNDIEIGLAEWSALETAREEQGPLAATFASAGPSPRRRTTWWVLATALACAAAVATVWLRRPQLLPERPVAQAPSAGRIEALSADVQVLDESGAAVPAMAGREIFSGQAVRVAEGEGWAAISLNDESQLTLAGGAVVRLFAARGDEGMRIELASGVIQVHAARHPADRPLILATDHARFTVLGTRLRLYRTPEASRIELKEGRVEMLRLADRQSIELAAGTWAEATAADAASGPLRPQPLPAVRTRLRHTLLKAGSAVCFSPGGKLLVTAQTEQGLKVWEANSGQVCSSQGGSVGHSHGLAFTPAGDRLVQIGHAGTARLWPISADTDSRTALTEGSTQGAVSADARWIATTRRGEKEIVVWKVDARENTISRHETVSVDRLAFSLAVVPGKPRLAYGLVDGSIVVQDVGAQKPLHKARLKSIPERLALSVDGRSLAASSHTDGLVLIDVDSGRRTDVWAEGCPKVADLRFSADGRLLLAGLHDGTARAWTVADRRLVLLVESGGAIAKGVALSADGAVLATATDQDDVKIWECDAAEIHRR